MNSPRPSDESKTRRKSRRDRRLKRMWHEGMPTHKSNPEDGFTVEYEEHVWRELVDAAELTVECWCSWRFTGPTDVAQRRLREHRETKEGAHGDDPMNVAVRELMLEIRKQGKGFKIVPSGRDHYKVLDGSGNPIVDESGPLTIAATPSDTRTVRNDRARLRRAGVLPMANERDERAEKKKSDVRDLAAERAQREAEASRSRADRTLAIRQRLEPLVAGMGGWDKAGMQANFGRALFQHAKDNSISIPSTIDSALMNVHTLRKGQTLSDAMAGSWDSFLDRLELYENPDAIIQSLVHRQKGTPPPEDQEAPRFKKSVTQTTETILAEERPTPKVEKPHTPKKAKKKTGRPPASAEKLARGIEIKTRLKERFEKEGGTKREFSERLMKIGKTDGWNPSANAKKPKQAFTFIVANFLSGSTKTVSPEQEAWFTNALDRWDQIDAAGIATPAPTKPPAKPTKRLVKPSPGPVGAMGRPARKRPAKAAPKKEKALAEKAKTNGSSVTRIDDAPTLGLRVFADLVTSGNTSREEAMDVAKAILLLEINDLLAANAPAVSE